MSALLIAWEGLFAAKELTPDLAPFDSGPGVFSKLFSANEAFPLVLVTPLLVGVLVPLRPTASPGTPTDPVLPSCKASARYFLAAL